MGGPRGTPPASPSNFGALLLLVLIVPRAHQPLERLVRAEESQACRLRPCRSGGGGASRRTVGDLGRHGAPLPGLVRGSRLRPKRTDPGHRTHMITRETDTERDDLRLTTPFIDSGVCGGQTSLPSGKNMFHDVVSVRYRRTFQDMPTGL